MSADVLDTEIKLASGQVRMETPEAAPMLAPTVEALRGQTRVLLLDAGLYSLTVGPTVWLSGDGGVRLPLTHVSSAGDKSSAAIDIAATTGSVRGWLGAAGGTAVVKASNDGGTVLITTYGLGADQALPVIAIERLAPPAVLPAPSAETEQDGLLSGTRPALIATPSDAIGDRSQLGRTSSAHPHGQAAFYIDGPFQGPGTLAFYGTEILIKGWAVLPDQNYRLACYLAGRFVHAVVPTELRRDVLQQFSWLPEDYKAGFAVTLMADPKDLGGEPRLRIALERGAEVLSGREYRLALGEPRVEVYIDEIQHDNEGRIVCDPDNTRLSGWAVAQEAIDGITIAFGDGVPRGVHYGIIRPDVFRGHPINPNGAAVGFSCFIDRIPLDCQAFDLFIRLRNGTSIRRRYGLALRPRVDSPQEFRRLSFAEQHLLKAEADPVAPKCCFVLVSSGRASGRRSVSSRRRTEASIALAAAEGAVETVSIEIGKGPAQSDPQGTTIAPELSRLIPAHLGDWAVFLAPGDTISPMLPLFLARGEYADNEFLYWDEITVSDRTETTIHKIPGAPFLTALHWDVVGRGWAVRIGGELARWLVAQKRIDLRALALEAFRRPDICTHIPEVLSRHVISPGTAPNRSAVLTGANAALQKCRSLFGKVTLVSEGIGDRLKLRPPKRKWPRISIVIPTAGSQNRILKCMNDLRSQTDYPELELIVIDHMPERPEYAERKRRVREMADAVLPVTGAFNWSEFNNRGAAVATGEVLLFLNDDVEAPQGDWLHRLLPYLSLERVGAVGPCLLTAGGTVQSCGVSLLPDQRIARNDFAFTGPTVPMGAGINQIPHNCTSLLGAAIMTRRETFNAVGGFDEALPLTFNDLDYHMKLRKIGLDVAVVPGAKLIHHERTSRFLIEEEQIETVYQRRWYRAQAFGDPYIHPALELDTGMYKIDPEPPQIQWNGAVIASRAAVRRILLLRLDHIGDFALTLPAFKGLRTVFPGAHITLVVGPWNVPLAQRLGLFDSIIPFDLYAERSGDGRNLGNFEAVEKLRAAFAQQSFDLAVDLRMDGDTRLLLTAIAATYRAGFSEGRKYPWLDISVEWEGNLTSWVKSANTADVIRRLTAVLAESFPDKPEIDPDLWPDGTADRPKPTKTGRRPLVILHPFAGNPIKTWHDQNWIDLARLLAEERTDVTVIGSPRDATQNANFIAELASVGATSAAGQYDVDALIDLIRAADCFVGCDSGPKHLAAAAGVPVVAIQSGFVDPMAWGPMNISGVSLVRRVTCAPCYLDDAALCPRDLACMTGITVRDVFRMTMRMLHAARTATVPSSSRLAPPDGGGAFG